MSDPADLINVAIEQLILERYELPAYSALDRLVGHIRQQVHEELYARITAPLGREARRRLEALLEVRPLEHVTDFTRLKETPGRATLKQMHGWAERLDWLLSILEIDRLLADVAHTKVRQFAAEASALEVGDMRDIASAARRHALLICLLHQAQVQTRDELVDMFLKRMRRTHNRAKDKLRQLQEHHRAMEEQMMEAFADVVEEAAHEVSDAALGRRVRRVLASYGGVETLQAQYTMVSAYHGDNYLPLLWDIHRSHRVALFRLLRLLQIESATQDQSLIRALHFAARHRHARRDYLPHEIALDFASGRWRALVQTRHRGELVLRRRELEVCVLSHVADALRCGDLYVVGSEAYADYREQLLPWEACQERLSAYCQALELPEDAGSFVEELRTQLTEAARRADQAYPQNTELALDAEGRPHLKRMTAKPQTEGIEAMKARVHERMPERHLLDILKHVHFWAPYTRHFGPPSGSDPKLSDPVSRYLFTVFGYGWLPKMIIWPLPASSIWRHTAGLLLPQSQPTMGGSLGR